MELAHSEITWCCWNGQIRSVAKALKILDLLATTYKEMSLAEIAQKIDLSKSTLHGLLSTMGDFGYIEQSAFGGRYRLRVRLFEIGNAVANNWTSAGWPPLISSTW
ncbi:helix-turn-helix domain-containing protein [Moorella sp. E308F]|uniref:helix-turn-helix domain-containing protein n=1 Tax=Moorella sp. E308F TaxID=2572682 RepID=UPI001C0E9729|nr:helix-turn-helix domain-containing protein [Moorella sp. E308F]